MMYYRQKLSKCDAFVIITLIKYLAWVCKIKYSLFHHCVYRSFYRRCLSIQLFSNCISKFHLYGDTFFTHTKLINKQEKIKCSEGEPLSVAAPLQ